MMAIELKRTGVRLNARRLAYRLGIDEPEADKALKGFRAWAETEGF